MNAGDFDPLAAMADLAERYGAWFHVDGAFGLFAALSPRTKHLVEGVERADSVIADGHKWLNVPYENGFAFVRDRLLLPARVRLRRRVPARTSTSRSPTAGYLGPEMSRRARALPVWATLRAYGREGYRAIVERDLDLAQTPRGRGRRGARSGAPGRRAAQHRVLPLPARKAPRTARSSTTSTAGSARPRSGRSRVLRRDHLRRPCGVPAGVRQLAHPRGGRPELVADRRARDRRSARRKHVAGGLGTPIANARLLSRRCLFG